MGTSSSKADDIEVSVVLAVKNEEQYIASALLSILQQQGVRLEVIVVDDGSADGTYRIAGELAKSDHRVRLDRNPGIGKCSAFNHGVRQASGRFVCIFAGDDLMPPGSLAARHNLVKGHSDDTPVVGLCKIMSISADRKFDGAVVPRRRGRGALSGSSPLMNRLACRRIFPVPESLPNEDTWMELAVSHLPDMAVIHSDIIGCHWRVHEGNSINMMVPFNDYNKRITARIRALPMFLERFGAELPEANRAYLRARIECEDARLRGDLLGILSSRVGLVDKLRSISIANGLIFSVRQRLYGLMSGW